MAVSTAKKIGKIKDSIVIPLKEYEGLLLASGKIKTAKMTLTQKKAWHRAREQFTRGEYLTLDQLRHELGIDSR